MNPLHCLIAHPPNPPFQPTLADVLRVHSGSMGKAGFVIASHVNDTREKS